MPESVCENWRTILPIIAPEDFIGWNDPSVPGKANCYNYCVKQLNNAGYKLKSPGWSTNQIIDGSIYQTYLAIKVGKMKEGYQTEQFVNGVNYLKNALASNTPVMVGVDAHGGSSSGDKSTDHYIIIVGMGSDANGKYFSFYDNATGIVKDGTSADNKIYCDCANDSLVGTGANSYARGGYGQYTITQIRVSTPNK